MAVGPDPTASSSDPADCDVCRYRFCVLISIAGAANVEQFRGRNWRAWLISLIARNRAIGRRWPSLGTRAQERSRISAAPTRHSTIAYALIHGSTRLKRLVLRI